MPIVHGATPVQMMQWFGQSWGAPINEDCPETDVPLGATCIWCGELVDEQDSGVVYSNGPVAHFECFIRQGVGGVNHQLGRCTCCGGTEDPDPEGLTKREAAVEAVRVFRRRNVW
jgi:hypothetical protein